MLRPANPHIICVAYCHIMRFAIYVTVSDVLVTTSIDLCVYRARFRCPGSHVNRLPSPPGHRLRIDKMLQCLTGMRPYRDSNVSLEVEESSSTPQTGSMEESCNAPNHRAPCLVWRITASSGVDVAGQQRNLRCMMRPKTKKPGGGGRRVREKREEGFSYGVRKNLATGMNFIPLTSSI